MGAHRVKFIPRYQLQTVTNIGSIQSALEAAINLECLGAFTVPHLLLPLS